MYESGEKSKNDNRVDSFIWHLRVVLFHLLIKYQRFYKISRENAAGAQQLKYGLKKI